MSKYYSTHLPEGTLHRMDAERDACGVGLIAQVDGTPSNRILRHALKSLCHVVHRGAVDADQKTGDGAGVLTQIPSKIFLPEAEKLGHKITDPKQLGVGVFFLPPDPASPEYVKAKLIVEGVVRNRGLKRIGWREVPTTQTALGAKAKATMPKIMHLLVSRPAGLDDDAFERRLYITRREIELTAQGEGVRDFYSSSFSHRTIIYKALLVATALEKFYQDLSDPRYETAIALFHQRFSTNTFPTWALGQPFRMLAHNGEINTLRGNRNWFTAREADLEHEIWGDEDIKMLRNVIDPDGSDSMSLDNVLELLVMSGRSVTHAMAMLVPPAWRIDPFTPDEQKAFYQYNRCFSEPWDGPAALCFTDGQVAAACLDRNGLRPQRYKLTDDGLFTIGSEVGLIDIDDAKVIKKGRLSPGEMISVDTREGKVYFDGELKQKLATRHPYRQWLTENVQPLSKFADPRPKGAEGDLDILTLSQRQVTFGYNQEELDMVFGPMMKDGQEPVYSMGDDAALAVLSKLPRLLYTYFKQLFAQVTNPPIDPIRERLVMSISASLGWERNLLKDQPENARILSLETPFLWNHELEALKQMKGDFEARVIDATWPVSEGQDGLEKAIERLRAEAEKAIEDSVRVLIISDRAVDHERAPVPAMIAVGSIHHHLMRSHRRMRVSLVLETGEARDVHQVACLFGYGASAVCPYLAYETIREMLENDTKKAFAGLTYEKALYNYRSALEKGLLKIMSKMGISVLSSYQGAQIFEAIGVGSKVIAECFAGTPSQVEGVGFGEIAAESLERHSGGYGVAVPQKPVTLEDPGFFRFRQTGEKHGMPNPIIKPFHTFVASGNQEQYKGYVESLKASRPIALHDLFELVPSATGPVPLDEVEPVEDIRVRFTTAAMSLGALSPEAHEALAIAMNEIGGKSNSGEGGEDPVRFKRRPDGAWANSKIKQVASGRFGVSAEYLASAEEIEIKMAQGAKPGEGGQLPGHKVNGLIARLRRTQPGVTLISPPPHHDIYSIEDLAQLIHDLKEVNPRARVCVKLVAESGVGTVAAGVAKANADIILVSGHEGGTGASPLSSIKHAGLPWELGIAETQQVLMLNGLRDRVTLRTDGGLRTGLDIVHAALLGAEEYNFGTIALIALGCVYVRKCHTNQCPVGIATQDPKYREKYKGKPEYVINFFNSVATEVREIMANLGVRSMNEMIGRTDFLRQREVPDHPKANLVRLDRVLRNVCKEKGEELARTWNGAPNIGLHGRALDDKIILEAKDAITDRRKLVIDHEVKNTNRDVGTKLSGEIALHHGDHGLEEGTITLNLEGSAGQSLGAFLCGGVKIVLTGEANDYVGKGMCGGQIIVRPPAARKFVAGDNTIIGNVTMYGATGGQLFANGQAGERFCVRNSGGTAVVEGIGDHGCEYMTNGVVVVLGPTGKNFGAGMSGGVAYVLDLQDRFRQLYNGELIEVVALSEPDDINQLKGLIYQHLEVTDSERAREILGAWDTFQSKFWKVQPKGAKPAAEVKAEVKEEALAKV